MYIPQNIAAPLRSLALAAVSALTIFAATACGSSFEERLTEEAKEYTANHCPEKVEDGMYLDSIGYDGKTNVYTSYYSVDANAESLLNGNIPLLHELLLRQLKDNVEYKTVKEHLVTFAYLYRSKVSGRTIYTTRIEAKEYE